MDDEAVWKRRFLVFMLVRLGGLLLFFIGLAIGVSDWVSPGGMPWLGIPVALLGLAEAVLAPRFLKRLWGIQRP